MTNPLLDSWDTPHGLPPFDKIRAEHYLPAFEAAIDAHRARVSEIEQQGAAPDFWNTIEALELAETPVQRLSAAFNTVASSNTNDEIKALQKQISPMLAAYFSSVWLRETLFARVDAVFRDDAASLTDEQQTLLEETHRKFVRNGAALPATERERVLAIDEQLATLQTQYGQNVLNDSNEFTLVLESEDELAGLPDSVRKAAAGAAQDRDMPGKFVFTLSRSSIEPFLYYSDRRDLRETMWRAYTSCGDNNNSFDNNVVAEQIATLRAERARLLGYNNHAEYVLEDRMAGTPAAVRELLDKVRAPATQRVLEERDKLQDRIQTEGGNFRLAPWDWFYYSEKVRQDEFALDSEAIKPYFELNAVRNGAFEVAGRLFGIRFVPQPDIETYHPDVEAFEVYDRDDSLIGLFLTDYYMRPSKRSGAWMNALRVQSEHGEPATPIILNTCNFPKATPTLLGMDEVRTLFHEFGHGLHGLLSKVRYRSLSGTAVKRDFVELPSQIMEHWALEPEVLREFASHYQTGEVIPDDLIEKIRAADTFNQGFATTEYLAASYLDLDWHSLTSDNTRNRETVESESMAAIDLIEEVAPRYRSTYFQHIFSGGYSAGYYSYLWAEVLDADAYDAFRENGIFDTDTAQSFRKHILERGGTADPMSLYRAFRGRDPEVTPLLEGRGLV